MEKIIINGKNAIFGRMASLVAKELLKGKFVEVINCEEIIISGNKKNFAKEIIQKRNMGRGSSLKGPKYIRREDLIIKRMIRGMLPIEKETGRNAYKRLRCHIGNGDLEESKIKSAISLSHQIPLKHSTIKEIFKILK